MRRVVLGGPELDGFTTDEPAASVRLLLPPPGSDTIVMPQWTGNQFELPTGERAPIRTFTPLFDGDRRLMLDVVLHEHGAASDWVRSVDPGDEIAVSGFGRGYRIDSSAESYLVAGDETAIPAITQVLAAIPETTSVDVFVEIVEGSDQPQLPDHQRATVHWQERPPELAPGDTLVTGILALDRTRDAMWVAGEAAAMQRIRTHAFDVLGMSRSAATIRGYWKHGRSAT